MNLLKLIFNYQNKPANIAKKRLINIFNIENINKNNEYNFLPKLQNELFVIINKYMEIDPNLYCLTIKQQNNTITLNIILTKLNNKINKQNYKI